MLHPYNRKEALHFSHQGEGELACSHLLPEVRTAPHFPLQSWPQPLLRSLWFPPLPFLGAGRMLGVLGNGCVSTALSRPRLPHHPPAACLWVSAQASRSGRGHWGPVQATQSACLRPPAPELGFCSERDQEYRSWDLGQDSLRSPGVTEKLESMVLTLTFPWHLTILQPKKGKIIRNNPKFKRDPETRGEIQMSKWFPWKKRVIGNLIPLFQKPRYSPRLTFRKRTGTLARIPKSRCKDKSY